MPTFSQVILIGFMVVIGGLVYAGLRRLTWNSDDRDADVIRQDVKEFSQRKGFDDRRGI